MERFLTRFRDSVTRDWPHLPLDELAFCISGCANPDLDLPAELRRLDDLAAQTPDTSFADLTRHLFATLDFRGDTLNYYDPRNSYLSEVLNRKLGIPILLATLAIEVGRRNGVNIQGVGMPGHFLVCDGADPSVLADPFNGGKLLTEADCEALFRAHNLNETPFRPEHLAPVGATDIITRVLNNLRLIHYAERDPVNMSWVCDMMASLPTVSELVYVSLVELHKSRGDFARAAQTCRKQAEMCEDAARREAYLVDEVRFLAFLN